MTSVKEVLVDATPDGGPGRGRFRFTDDYSVFDWGKMPDAIPGKGQSLCVMGATSFELLESADVPTHYRGVVEDGETVDLADVDAPPREMAIDLANVPDLPHDGRSYDYETYHEAAGDCYLVPLEIVFRNVVPVGSSLRDRASPADLGLDADAWPDEAVDLPEPVVEFSTKLEDGDRYLEPEEADRIAGDVSIEELARVADRTNQVVTRQAAAAGLTHQDGKIECIAVDGEVRVADVAGTLDENRFSYDGTQVSKECLRQHYKRTQPEWVAAVSDAKDEAREADVADWKQFCEASPDELPADVRDAASDLYRAGANAYAARSLFDAPPLPEAVAAVRSD